MKQLIAIFSSIFFTLGSLSQGYYVNHIWDQSCGSPTSIDPRMKSELDPNGNLVIVSSTDNGNNTDIYLNCLNPDGSIVWGQTCSSCPIADDWGEDLVIDDVGNIYICGVRGNGTNYDFLIAKYDISGNLIWNQTYDNGGDDHASAIALDASGDVFVTGTSQTGFILGNTDLTTLKLDGSNGNVLWSQLYDFNNLPEVGVDVEIDNSGDVIVCGASAQTILDTRFTILKYSASNGNQLDIKRHNSPGNGYDLPSEMILSNDQIYVVGSSNLNTTDSDVKLLCLNSLLNVVWVNYYDRYGGKNDVGNALAISNDQSIAVTGYCENAYGGTEFMTSLYSPTGNLLWCQVKNGENEFAYAEGKDIIFSSDNHILVTGFVEEEGYKKYRTASYSMNAEINWQRIFSQPLKDSRGGRILSNGDDVFVTGDVSGTAQKSFTSVKYIARQRDGSFKYSQGKPIYMRNQLIVKFDPSILEMTEVSNMDKEHWLLEEILESEFADKVKNVLLKSCSECPIRVYRIFRGLDPSYTTTLNRLGMTINVPEFWSVFVLEFPDGTDISQVSDDLMLLFPDINYSTFNLLGESQATASDPEYDQQISLHYDITGTWPNTSNINIEPAWDYSVGRRDIKIGVFEEKLIQWTHEDFGGQTISTTKVDGWQLYHDVALYDTIIYGGIGHPTQVAGIVGAIRNNDKGIAGVAGGNYEYSNDLDSSGCALFGLSMGADTIGPILLDYVAAAIVGTSIEDSGSNYGYGLNISNNSWAIVPALELYIDTNITLLRDAFHFANRAQVSVVASRGNYGEYQDTTWYWEPLYPATFDDDWILCVGGTGTDGNYMDNSDTINEGFEASRGFEIDFAAPACKSHNYTTIATSGFNGYTYFDGTSASAPHVSGLAGLLMSYLNDVGPSYNNLAPEDVEHIIEVTAEDRDISGKDSLTGYGMVNAGAALAYVNKYIRKLRHFGTSSVPYTSSSTQISTNDTITLSEIYQNVAGSWFQPNIPFVVNTYSVDFSCNHYIPPGETIEDYWVRPSGSSTFGLFGSDNVVYPREKIEIISLSQSNAYLRGYVYEVSDTLGNPLGWWPFDPNGNHQAEYTVLTSGNFASVEDLENDVSISIYPNPTNGNQSISITLHQPTDVTIRIFNNEGKLIETVFSGNLVEGKNIITYDISYLSSGIYIYVIQLDNQGTKHVKVIKE